MQIYQGQTAQNIPFYMVESADHITPLTGASPAVILSANGGAPFSATGAIVETGNGWYYVTGNATDAATIGSLSVHATAASGDPSDSAVQVVSADSAYPEGLVYIDGSSSNTTGNSPGTDGTASNPVGTITQAIAIISALAGSSPAGICNLGVHVHNTVVWSDSFTGSVKGDGSTSVLTMAALTVVNTDFEGVAINDTDSPSSIAGKLSRCTIDQADCSPRYMEWCAIYKLGLTAGNPGEGSYWHCYELYPGFGATCDFKGTVSQLGFYDWAGDLTLKGMVAGSTVDIDGIGTLTIDATSAGAIVNVVGPMVVNDLSGGANTINILDAGAAYPDGCVYLNTISGTAGHVPGINGTASLPCTTQADAEALCAALNITTIRFYGQPILNQQPATLTWIGTPNAYSNLAQLNLNGQAMSNNPTFVDCFVVGVAGGVGGYFINCSADGLTAGPWSWDGGYITNLTVLGVSATYENLLLEPSDGGNLTYSLGTANILSKLSGLGSITLAGGVLQIDGNGQFYVYGTGTLNYTGDIKITDYSSGGVTINNLNPDMEGITPGSVTSALPTPTTFDGSANLSTIDGQYVKVFLCFTSGVNIGVSREVSAYVGSTQGITVGTAFPSAPAQGDAFILIGLGP